MVYGANYSDGFLASLIINFILSVAFHSSLFRQRVLKEDEVKMPSLHHLQPDVPFTFLKTKIWGFIINFIHAYCRKYRK